MPRTGLAYVTVGREAEIAALLRDVDTVADGGASGVCCGGKPFPLQKRVSYS